jgi:hypothetical protein
MKFGFLVLGVLTAASAVGALGCSSTKAPPTARCLLASDCKSPLVCAQGYCVGQCVESRDCPPGQRCVTVNLGAGDAGAVDADVLDAASVDGGTGDAGTGSRTGMSCQPPDIAMCQNTAQCRMPLTCADDQQCRNQCTAAADCPMGQRCTTMSHLCADPTVDKDYDPDTNEFRSMSGAGTDGATSGGDGASSDGAGASSDGDGDGPQMSCPGTGLARFHPSNLPTPLVLPTDRVAYTQSVDGTFDTDSMTFTPTPGASQLDGGADDGGANPWNAQHFQFSASDIREATVVYFERYTLGAKTTLTITGQRPLIIAGDGDIEIDGSIVTAPSADPVNLGWNAGGPPGPPQPLAVGICALNVPDVGGGNPGASDRGSGGGSFCGIGGAGSPAFSTGPVDGGADGGTGPSGGAVYGTNDLVPLVGGSSGGSTDYATPKNHGGGAIELVSGTRVTVSLPGVINMGGGADTGSATGAGEPRIGGGSGGGILLEAPNVVVQGVLAANGASGSGYNVGQPGQASAQPAVTPLGISVKGGDGSGGAKTNGQDGMIVDAVRVGGGGGGGGAGRIRVNTGCGGKFSQNGGAVISPSSTTTCFSMGTLK